MRAARLSGALLTEGRKIHGRVWEIGAVGDLLAVGLHRGFLKKEIVWVSVQRGRFDPPLFEAVTRPAEDALVLLGKVASGPKGEAIGRVADLWVDLGTGKIQWLILSEGIWRDAAFGRRAVRFDLIEAVDGVLTLNEEETRELSPVP